MTDPGQPCVMMSGIASLQHLRLHTLRRIGNEFRAGPACRGNATAQVGELLVGNVDVKGTDVRGDLRGGGHGATSSQKCGSSTAWRPLDLGIDRDLLYADRLVGSTRRRYRWNGQQPWS